jgi:hypothetical protein
MGYLYLLMGVIISPAVIPATLTLLWADQSWAAATFAPPLGFACSVISWLVTTKAISGELTVETTGANIPMLVGNCVALLSPLLFIPILTYCPPSKPQKYDWQSMLNIRVTDDRDMVIEDPERLEEREERLAISAAAVAEDTAKLNASAKTARWLCISLTIALLVLWPMPLFGTGYVFSSRFFTGWVVVGILWLFISCGMVVVLPIYESRSTISRTTRAICKDLMGLGGKKGPEVVMGEKDNVSGSMTPPEVVGKMGEKTIEEKT